MTGIQWPSTESLPTREQSQDHQPLANPHDFLKVLSQISERFKQVPRSQVKVENGYPVLLLILLIFLSFQLL
ncbi:hypothetical protein NG798_25510 [Ancylothrix sp. C2]|uniref:hypothetical protein n=1 Tax=Ancylothrix sp. D3o TaxID=2953691 RepID=UPI0021BA65B3|nr:hypothetical protein [Ancylothrix sp. D3o]MCT7953161.1 hypothetical protein [Ancylothrix sp. D3o]